MWVIVTAAPVLGVRLVTEFGAFTDPAVAAIYAHSYESLYEDHAWVVQLSLYPDSDGSGGGGQLELPGDWGHRGPAQWDQLYNPGDRVRR